MLYRQISGLRHYLLRYYKSVHAELYSLDEHSCWVPAETRDPAAVLGLISLDYQVR